MTSMRSLRMARGSSCRMTQMATVPTRAVVAQKTIPNSPLKRTTRMLVMTTVSQTTRMMRTKTKVSLMRPLPKRRALMTGTIWTARH